MAALDIIREHLFEMKDEKYKAFNSKLIPTVNPDLIIGVRTPALRKYATELKNTDCAGEFMSNLPHKYYEENNLHAFLIEKVSDYNRCLELTEQFLPYIDNWATCDSFNPKCYKKHPNEMLENINRWINSKKTYTIRFGIRILMNNYLDELFESSMLDTVAEIKSDEYYVNMMCAWCFATALTKQYEAALPYIEGKKLSTWVHNKSIQKAVESYRITDDQKQYLKTLKIKLKQSQLTNN